MKSFIRKTSLSSIVWIFGACMPTKFGSSTSQPAPATTTPPMVAPLPASANASGSLSPAAPDPVNTPVTPQTNPPGATITIPTDCTNAGGATQAVLLTPTITNGDPNNLLKYQLFITDCNGQHLAFTNDKISFWCDGNFNGNFNTPGGGAAPPPFTYTVTDGTNQITGNLPFVQLNAGNYSGNYVNQTDQPVTFAATANSIQLTIYEHGLSVTPRQGSNQLHCSLVFGNTAAAVNTVQLISQ